MTWTIYIQEINDGHLDFQTKEEAWKWLDDLNENGVEGADYDNVKWTNTKIRKVDLVHEPD